jgi:hypothetical protein
VAVVPVGRVEPARLLLVVDQQVQEQVRVLVTEIPALMAPVAAVVVVKKVDLASLLFAIKRAVQHVHPHKALLILTPF